MLRLPIQNIKNKLDQFDYTLLIFILMMSQDRILVKVAAIGFIFLMRFNFKFGFRENRLPLFYLAIIIVEVLKYIFMSHMYLGNWATLLVSALYWGFSLLSIHQVKLSIERYGYERSVNTIKALTLVNFIFCMTQFIHVMMVTGAINPYALPMTAPDIRFPDVIVPYGQSSGDQLRGVFYDNHHHAIIVQLCFVFFLYTRRYLFALLNFVVIILICFNLITLLTLMVMGLLFFLLRGREIKLFITSLVFLLGLFYVFVSPENAAYLQNRLGKTMTMILKEPDNRIVQDLPLTAPSQERHEHDITKQAAASPDDIQPGKSQHEGPNIVAVDSAYDIDKVSGKRVAYRQTVNFLRSNPVYAVFGCGAGMFSSKLANNFSGVFYGPTILNKNLPQPSYQVFHAYHGSFYKYFQKLEIGKHSIDNFPNSVYDQLLSEYGILGLLLFVFFYLFYFLKRYRQLTFGLILIPLLLIGFNYGYYFESLDITVFFEFLMFLDLSKNQTRV